METTKLVIDREFSKNWFEKMAAIREQNESEYWQEIKKQEIATVPGRVGQGGKVHSLVVHHIGGKVTDIACWCGSQKFNRWNWHTSGLTLLPEGTPITCKKCLH